MTTVLLHGFTGASDAWGSAVLDGLASVSDAVVTLDLPGHGRHGGDADPAHHTLDHLFGEIETAAGGEPVDLVGYSMGGRLALAYAVNHPRRVRRLVLESASPGLPTEMERAARREADEALADFILAQGMEAFVDRWEGLPLFESQKALPEAERQRVRQRRLRNVPAGLAASLRGLGTGALPSFWDRLRTLDAPVLLLVGELDRKFVDIAHEMDRLIPNPRLRVVPGAGHTVHLERPDVWLAEVVDFLGAGG